MQIERIFNNSNDQTLDVITNILIDILIKDYIAKSTTEEVCKKEVAA